VVIFYDGANDAAAAGPSPGPPNPHFYFGVIKARIEGSISGRFDFLRQLYASRLAGVAVGSLRRPRSTPLSIAESHAKAEATLDNYEANLQLAKALSKAYNFKIYCFWQPALYYSRKPLVPFEQLLRERDARDAQESAWALVVSAAYQEAESRSARTGDFVFLGGLFDSIREPVYIDEVHVGPRGNELAAQAIAKYIEEQAEDR
jgi:hypothetical protein